MAIDRVKELLARHVDVGAVPGAVAVRGSGDPDIVAVGFRAIGGAALSGNEIFRIQSMTKAITAVAALRLVEAGRLGLDDSVEPWLPELSERQVLRNPAAALTDTTPAVRPITLRHLLTNASGYGVAMEESPLQEAMDTNGTAGGADPPALGRMSGWDDWPNCRWLSSLVRGGAITIPSGFWEFCSRG